MWVSDVKVLCYSRTYLLGDWDKPRFDFKVPSKLLKCDLSFGTHDDVGSRVVDVFA